MSTLHAKLLLTLAIVGLITLASFAPSISGDVSIRESCSSLVIQTDKDTYLTGESVSITVTFVHLMPGCFEFMIAHDYVIMLTVMNSAKGQVYSYSNATVGNLTIHEVWNPPDIGNYTIVASSWLRLAGNESMVKQLEVSKAILVQAAPSPHELSEPGIASLGAVAIVLVLLISLKRRSSLKPRKSSFT